MDDIIDFSSFEKEKILNIKSKYKNENKKTKQC